MIPRISYFICTEPRTGGHFLAECLRNTGLAGSTEEYFWKDNEKGNFAKWNIYTYEDYLQKAFGEGTSENGIFGAKVGMGEESWGNFANSVLVQESLNTM